MNLYFRRELIELPLYFTKDGLLVVTLPAMGVLVALNAEESESNLSWQAMH